MFAHLLTTTMTMLAVSIPVAASSTVIYVDANADQVPHNGADWHHAFIRLEEALIAAAPQTEIRIADGAYKPDPTGLSDPREATFDLVQGTILKGGFAGCGAPDPDANDPAIYETILSGDIGVPGAAADNCHHVLTGASLDNDTVVEGVTVTGGNANGSGVNRQGGGLLLINASPIIRGCVFRVNQAEFGGGVFNSGGHPAFVATSFDENSATGSGGAAYNYNVLGNPPPSFAACTFEDNTAQGHAGAMRNYDCLVDVDGCEFRGNLARYGGGAVANGGATVATFSRCLFEYNRADTLFALHDAHGGAMLNADTSQGLLQSCAFHLNVANSTLPGISYGGALAQTNSAALTLVNCTMVSQRANIGADIYGSGDGTTTVTSSILSSGGGEIAIAGAATINVAYSAVTGLWSGAGNIGDDPLLEDLRLQPGSPCINAGDPTYNLAAEDRDLGGHARVLCDRVDMGAFEFGIGDYDCDQSLELTDFSHWEDCMTGPVLGPYASGCETFDYEFDQDVDLADFTGFQAGFAGSP